MFYSKSTGGFYLKEIHGYNIPADAVEITEDTHAALIYGQSEGRRIVANASGIPELQNQPAPTSAERKAAIQAQVDEIEFKTLMNRATREFLLLSLEKEASSIGVTPAQLYITNSAYKAVKDVDTQIAALRTALKALP